MSKLAEMLLLEDHRDARHVGQREDRFIDDFVLPRNSPNPKAAEMKLFNFCP